MCIFLKPKNVKYVSLYEFNYMESNYKIRFYNKYKKMQTIDEYRNFYFLTWLQKFLYTLFLSFNRQTDNYYTCIHIYIKTIKHDIYHIWKFNSQLKKFLLQCELHKNTLQVYMYNDLCRFYFGLINSMDLSSEK